MTTINNPKHDSVKRLLTLRKSGKRSDAGTIMVEGRDEVAAALRAGLGLRMLYHCPAFGVELPAVAPDSVTAVGKTVFERLSVRQHPDGLLAEFAEPAPRYLEQATTAKDDLVLVLEGLEKPGNLGGIIRTALAVGVSKLIIAETRTDIYNHNVIRASRGAVFFLPIYSATNEEAGSWLEKNAVTVYALVPASGKVYTTVDFRGKKAFVVGEEHSGISEFWLKTANKITIPMRSGLDSLNASVSTAIVLYESFRQNSFLST